MSKLLALLMSALMTFGGAAPAASAISYDAVVTSRAELHLSAEEVNFRAGDVIRLTVEPAASAQPLGWEVRDIAVSSDALRPLDNNSPEAEAKREELRQTSQTMGNPDDGQLAIYLLALRSGSAKIHVELQNAFYPQETLSLSVETAISGATNPPPTDTSGGGSYPDGPITKPDQPDPDPSVSPDPSDPVEPTDPVDPTPPVEPTDPGGEEPDPDNPPCPSHDGHELLHLGQQCPNCEVIGTLPHQYGDWQTVTDPTVDTVGEEERVCGCGASETREIPKLLVFNEQDWALDLGMFNFVYDGTTQTPLWDLDGLPEGIKATIKYFDADGEPVEHPTNAGTYTYTVQFDVPSTYAPVDEVTGSYTIDPATLTLRQELDENGQVAVVLDGLVDGDVVDCKTNVSNSIVDGKVVDATAADGPVNVANNDYSIISTEVNLTEGGNYVIADADRTTIYQTQTTPETSWFNVEAQLHEVQGDTNKVVVEFYLKDLKTDQFATHKADLNDTETYEYTPLTLSLGFGYDHDALEYQGASANSQLTENDYWDAKGTADGFTISHLKGPHDDSQPTMLCAVIFEIKDPAQKDILLTVDSTLRPLDSDDQSLPFEYKATSSVLVINPSGDIDVVEVPVEGDLKGNATYTGSEDDDQAKQAADEQLQQVIDGLTQDDSAEGEPDPDTNPGVTPDLAVSDTLNANGASAEVAPAATDVLAATDASSDDATVAAEQTDLADEVEQSDLTDSELADESAALAGSDASADQTLKTDAPEQPAASDSVEPVSIPTVTDFVPALQQNTDLGLAA